MIQKENLADGASYLIDRAMQAGRDEMARVLADWLPTIATENQLYRDGAEDALLSLTHHGATDPR